MRISDWSSDVCSSDLPLAPVRRRRRLDQRDHRELVVGRAVVACRPLGEASQNRAAAQRFGMQQLDVLAQRRILRQLALQLAGHHRDGAERSEEHTSELQSLMRISYAVFCLKKKNKH